MTNDAYDATDDELAAFEAAVAEVMAEHDLTEEQARDLLDDWWDDAELIDAHAIHGADLVPMTTVDVNPAYL